jgi:putative membrane protein insertion efficiency factor
MAAAALAMLDVYRAFVSPLFTAVLGHACRFHPNCSAYAREAVAIHGLGRGGWLAMRRLLRCRPGGGWGEDPVPAREAITQG